MNRRGILAFTLLLAFVPAYMVLADFEMEKTAKIEFTKTVLLELERGNYIRTEMEINTDQIIEEKLRQALALKKAGETVAAAADIMGVIIPEKELAGMIFNELAARAIFMQLADYYRQCEKNYHVAFKQELGLIEPFLDDAVIIIDASNNYA